MPPAEKKQSRGKYTTKACEECRRRRAKVPMSCMHLLFVSCSDVQTVQVRREKAILLAVSAMEYLLPILLDGGRETSCIQVLR
jgi:hypothetical protein